MNSLRLAGLVVLLAMLIGVPVAHGQLLLSTNDNKVALVNGVVGAVSTLDGELFSVGAFTVRGGRIAEIDILADPARLSRLDLTVLDD